MASRTTTLRAERIRGWRWSGGVTAAVVTTVCLRAAGAAALSLVVNNNIADLPDALPGDGVCATSASTCTLRAAIQEANASAGPDTITLPAGTVTLSLNGIGEDQAATGDLDIVGDVTVVGADTGSIINTNGNDRVFDIFPPATVVLTKLTIQNGRAQDGPGGAIRNAGTLIITATTLRNNRSQSDGGGIANVGSGTLQLINTTLSGNTAPNGNGGGIFNPLNCSMVLSNVTLSGNSAMAGTSLDNFGTAQLRNTIVANSTPATSSGNCHGSAVTSLGHNIDTGISCLFSEGSDLDLANPLLGPLQNNGGPTATFALLTGSPAIDAGDDVGCPATDQRGQPRPTDGNNDGVPGCDIGAYEAPGTVFPTSTPSNTLSPTVGSPTPTSTPTLPTATPTATEATTAMPTATATNVPIGPSLALSTAIGMPGDQVSFSATLSAAMSTVVSAQNKVAFGSFNTPIASLSNGAPDCTADPSLGRRFPVFVFMPPQCSPTGQSLTDAEPVPCTVLLAAVIALSPTDFDPIPDGSTLYTCRVNISPTAPAGEYPLVISQIVLSDAHGTPVPGATGSNGKIIVLAPPTATPTETPTATPSDTVTPTATASATPSATLTPTPSATPVPCAGDCNGNQQVTVDELLTLVQAALLGLDARACPAGDLSRVSQITVVEILTAVNRAVDTCQSAL